MWIPGLLHKHIASIHGTVVSARVVMVLVSNMGNAAANATARGGYHFNAWVIHAVIII